MTVASKSNVMSCCQTMRSYLVINPGVCIVRTYYMWNSWPCEVCQRFIVARVLKVHNLLDGPETRCIRGNWSWPFLILGLEPIEGNLVAWWIGTTINHDTCSSSFKEKEALVSGVMIIVRCPLCCQSWWKSYSLCVLVSPVALDAERWQLGTAYHENKEKLSFG